MNRELIEAIQQWDIANETHKLIMYAGDHHEAMKFVEELGGMYDVEIKKTGWWFQILITKRNEHIYSIQLTT